MSQEDKKTGRPRLPYQKITLAISIPKGLKKNLVKIAAHKEITLTTLCLQWLKEFVKKEIDLIAEEQKRSLSLTDVDTNDLIKELEKRRG